MSRPHRFAAAIATALLAACAAPAERHAATPAAVADLANVPACPLDASPMDGWSDRAPPRKFRWWYSPSTRPCSSVP